jgi:homoserine dehydrogenase
MGLDRVLTRKLQEQKGIREMLRTVCLGQGAGKLSTVQNVLSDVICWESLRE